MRIRAAVSDPVALKDIVDRDLSAIAALRRPGEHNKITPQNVADHIFRRLRIWLASVPVIFLNESGSGQIWDRKEHQSRLSPVKLVALGPPNRNGCGLNSETRTYLKIV